MLYFSDYTDKISVGNKSWQSNMFPTTFLRIIAKVSLFSAHMKISGEIKGFAWANYGLTHSINPKKKQCLKQCIFAYKYQFHFVFIFHFRILFSIGQSNKECRILNEMTLLIVHVIWWYNKTENIMSSTLFIPSI